MKKIFLQFLEILGLWEPTRKLSLDEKNELLKCFPDIVDGIYDERDRIFILENSGGKKKLLNKETGYCTDWISLISYKKFSNGCFFIKILEGGFWFGTLYRFLWSSENGREREADKTLLGVDELSNGCFLLTFYTGVIKHIYGFWNPRNGKEITAMNFDSYDDATHTCSYDSGKKALVDFDRMKIGPWHFS